MLTFQSNKDLKKVAFDQLVNSIYYQMDMLDYLMCKGNEKACNILACSHSSCCDYNDINTALNHLNIATELYHSLLGSKLHLLYNCPIFSNYICTKEAHSYNQHHCRVCRRSKRHSKRRGSQCPLQHTCCAKPTSNYWGRCQSGF